jgi:dTDP-4-amino-4,6-dideoxygalactose transaminase
METRPTADASGGKPAGRDRWYAVPFQRPSLPDTAEIEQYFAQSRAEGWYSNFGPCHELLVRRSSGLLGNRAIVPVSSAGIGLIAALRALVPPGGSVATKVILPSFTFAATAAAVVWCGLEPVFCDVEAVGWHLCPAHLGEALRARPGQVAAILACSAFGTPPPDRVTHAWSALAEEWGIPLIVDSAAGLGMRGAACAPDAEVFSMHATKPLPIGEGGLVALRRDRVATAVRTVVNHGIGPDHLAVSVGLNGKLDEWHAAAALAGLDRLEVVLESRREAAAAIRQRLRSAGVRFQGQAEHSTAQFVPALMASGGERDRVLAAAESRRVQMRAYHSPPLHLMPAYCACERADELPTTVDLADRVLSLPLAADFTEAEQTRVVECFEI